MSKFTKTIAGFAGSVALIASLAGSVSAATFSTNLTVGSRGDDVTALQTWLIGKGYSIPAGATGYFGSQTRAAVSAYQTAKGISPTAGYFGPITRAAVNADGGAAVSTVPGCTAGAMYSSTTGAPCTTASTVPGCTAGAMYSSTTGAPCAGGTTTTAGTCAVRTEGSFTTRLASLPADNSNIRSTSDVPVYGIEVKAVKSDIVVDRVDLQVTLTPSGGSAQNPGSFITGLTFKDGSTVLKTVAVSASDFSKDSSDRYHILVSGIGFKVGAEATKVLTVTMNTASISSTDSNRAIAIKGYAGNANNIRGVDCAGIQSYTDMSATADTRNHTAKPAGNATLTVTVDSALTPDSGNTKVNSTDGVQKKLMLAFSAKAETGPAKLTKLYVTSNATATAGLPSTIYVASDAAGLNILSSVTGATAVGGEALLNNINVTIAQDTTSKFFILADFPTTANGQAASTSLAANSVQWEKPDGSTASTTPTSRLASADQYLYNAVPTLSLVSSSISSSVVSGSTTSTTTLTYKMNLKLTGNGGAMLKPVAGDFVLRLASSTQTTYSGSNSVVVGDIGGTTKTIDQVSPSDSTVGDGGSYTFSLTGVIDTRTATGGTTLLGGAGTYRMILTQASSTVSNTSVIQTWGLDDYQTASQVLPN